MGSNPIRYSKICTGSLAVKHRGIKTEFSDIGNQLIRSALKYYLSIDKGEPDMLPFVFGKLRIFCAGDCFQWASI
jgi:hypothetical protein